jgi:lysophospholipase L1-like esterase
MPHLALLGDATLANGKHTAPEPDTATILRQLLPDWTVTLLAVEGSTMAVIRSQLQRLPPGVDMIALSVGGNDAMQHVDVLQQPALSSGETLDALAKLANDFETKYDQLVQAMRSLAPRLLVCTIYEPPLVGANTARRGTVILTMLNDRILRTAGRWGLEALDLRSILNTLADFKLQIQPSAAGAAKIAQGLASVATGKGGRRMTVTSGS